MLGRTDWLSGATLAVMTASQRKAGQICSATSTTSNRPLARCSLPSASKCKSAACNTAAHTVVVLASAPPRAWHGQAAAIARVAAPVSMGFQGRPASIRHRPLPKRGRAAEFAISPFGGLGRLKAQGGGSHAHGSLVGVGLGRRDDPIEICCV